MPQRTGPGTWVARCLAVTSLWVACPSLAEAPEQTSVAGPAPEAGAPAAPGYGLWSLRASLSTEVASSLRPVGLGLDVQPYRHLRLGLYADALLDQSVGGRVLVPVLSVAPTPALSLSLMPGLGVDHVTHFHLFGSTTSLAINPLVMLAAQAWVTPRWGVEFQAGAGPAFFRSLDGEEADRVLPRLQFSVGLARSNLD